jgi:basic membrane lipoprotein Med (substrate-binding protein (PBP1-ABC) superfamily)
MQKYFGGSVVSDYVPLVAEDISDPDGSFRASDDCIDVVQALHSRGYRLIIAPSRFTACIQLAHDIIQDEKFYFTILGGPQPRRFDRISSGFVRDWEARYTSGIIAGAYSSSGKIGYITGFNSANHARLVFATYLGARLSRPDVKFYVMDSNSFDNSTRQLAAAKTLLEEVGCDILITVRTQQSFISLFFPSRCLTLVVAVCESSRCALLCQE